MKKESTDRTAKPARVIDLLEAAMASTGSGTMHYQKMAEAVQILRGETPSATCKWIDGTDRDFPKSGCTLMDFEFLDGGPIDNGYEFCPQCGKPVEVVKGNS